MLSLGSFVGASAIESGYGFLNKQTGLVRDGLAWFGSSRRAAMHHSGHCQSPNYSSSAGNIASASSIFDDALNDGLPYVRQNRAYGPGWPVRNPEFHALSRQ